MDCFDSHYYRLNRKLLTFVGQWPYQSLAAKVTRRVLYTTFFMFSDMTQLLVIVTTEVDFNLWIEIVSGQVTLLLAFIRTFLFAFNQAEVLRLLEIMKFNWVSLADKNEYEIFEKTTEEGKSHTFYYLKIVALGVVMNTIYMISTPLLSYVNLINGSVSYATFYRAEYFIDQQKYYYVILIHMFSVCVALATGILASDTFLLIFLYHNVGMFKIACYELEHAFDSYNSTITDVPEGKTVCQKIVRAVNWHRRALRFCDGIVEATQWTNLLSILLALVNVALSLYWMYITKGQGFGSALAMIMLLHIFCLAIPAQQVADCSEDIVFKAYSSMWYKAPAKEQNLLLLAMMRAQRTSYLQMGKIHPLTLENYGIEVKTAFSYFVVLLSQG